MSDTQSNVDDGLRLPVPYKLEMLGTGTFIAVWEPISPTPNLPTRLVGRSASSGLRAVERLYGELLKHGVVTLAQDTKGGAS